MSAFPRVYNSFAEFEREELRKLEAVHVSVDDLMEERFGADLESDSSTGGEAPRKRGRPRKYPR
jgi:hypothetical protein